MASQSQAPVPLLLALCLIVAGPIGACGVGAVQESAFVYGMMGPEGGTAKVGPISLTIPPGALVEPTAISVFPETTALPIAPPPGDRATYQLLQGFQWCCGPSGQALRLDALLEVGYQQVIAPQAVEESDVVLLLWDHAQGALVPAGDDVARDAAGDMFTNDHYRRMGHVALGLRTLGSSPEFAFVGFLSEQRVQSVSPQAIDGPITSGLYIAGEDASTPLLHLATDGLVPISFQPSPDGERVLYEMIDYSGETSGVRQLWSVDREALVPTLLAGDGDTIERQDPLFGWMRDGVRVFFQTYFPGDGDGVDESHVFTTLPRDGGEAADLYEVGGLFASIEDVRQSPDGEYVLIRYYGYYEEENIDIFDADTGAPVSQGLIPVGRTDVTPRFLPDSSGVYLVIVDDGGVSVVRYALDGTGPTTLFTPPREHGDLLDFVLAPNGDDFAYLTYVPPVDVAVGSPDALTVPGQDAIHVGSLSGGVRASEALGDRYFGYDEFLFHPNGENVFVDAWSSDVRIFAASDATEGLALPIQGVSQMDIHREDGRLLVVLSPQRETSPALVGAGEGHAFGPPGVYVAQPDGSEATQVELSAELSVLHARWLRSIRHAPCMNGIDLFR